MLRHEHEGNQHEVSPIQCGVDRPGQKPSPRVVGQQRQASVARKGQFVQIARLVEVLDPSAMLIGCAHHDKPTRVGKGGQATHGTQSAGVSLGEEEGRKTEKPSGASGQGHATSAGSTLCPQAGATFDFARFLVVLSATHLLLDATAFDQLAEVAAPPLGSTRSPATST